MNGDSYLNRTGEYKYRLKYEHLDRMQKHRKLLYERPQLKRLFLELTLKCNEYCFHCGSRCGDVKSEELSLEQYKTFLDKVKRDFDISNIQLCITGGEPLLRKDFFEIMGYANSLGYDWGMTSNATLIDERMAEKLAEAGMGTISVSIDGLRETHDRLRGLNGAYDMGMQGIQALIDNGSFNHVQITTIVNHENINELPELFEIFEKMDIGSWRIGTLEPIGRALDHPKLMLTLSDYRNLFEYIRDKRRQGYPVEYGCTHYVGVDYEREIRNWYFLCGAGTFVASVMVNGDIGACLDVERRPETVQGNILTDDFTDVWHNRFKIFRQDISDIDPKCKGCENADYCAGGAFHCLDLDNMKQRVCLRGI